MAANMAASFEGPGHFIDKSRSSKLKEMQPFLESAFTFQIEVQQSDF